VIMVVTVTVMAPRVVSVPRLAAEFIPLFRVRCPVRSQVAAAGILMA